MCVVDVAMEIVMRVDCGMTLWQVSTVLWVRVRVRKIVIFG